MSDKKLEVRVYPIDEPTGGTKAFAGVAVDDLAAIRGVRVVDSEKGLFVSMPQSQSADGEYHDIAFPLTADLRKEITAAVLDEYERMMSLPSSKRFYDAPEANTDGKSADEVKLDIRVYPLDEPKGGTKAFASVSMDDTIAIRGVRVIEGEKGLFASMPQSKDKDGQYHDIAFPLSASLRKEIGKAVVNEYKAVTKTADKSLAEGLKRGAEKSAGQPGADKSAAKNRNAEAIA
jgi:stage V sporulation protein G